jgi:hypothetical protein
MRKDIMMMVCLRHLVNMKCGREAGGVRGCHVTHHASDSKLCGEFYFHECATTDVFYTTIMTFPCVSMCSDIVHGGYKAIHHRGASRCECLGSRERIKWPKVWQNKSKLCLVL